MGEKPSTDKSEDAKSSGRLFPPSGVLFISGLLIAGMVAMIYYADRFLDEAPALEPFYYFIVILLGIIVFLLNLVWFVFGFRASLAARLLTIVGLIAGFVLFGVFFEFEQNDGSVIPRGVRLRSMARTYETLDVPTTNATDVDLSSKDPREFPQFLGPKRDLNYEDPIRGEWLYYDYDWQKNPPKEVWRKPIGAGWSGFVASNGKAVTLEQRGDSEVTTCYDIMSGEIVWANENVGTKLETMMGGVGPRSTPTINDGKVYSLGGTGILKCIEGKDGTTIWEKDLRKEFCAEPENEIKVLAWGRAGSPLVSGNLVIVPAGGPNESGEFVSLVAYDKKSGDEKWRAGTEQMSYASPTIVTIHNRPMVVSVNEANVAGYSLKDGEELWSYPFEGSSTAQANCSQPISIPGHRMLLSKGYGKGAELIEFIPSGAEYEVRRVWSNNKRLLTKFSNVAVLDNYGYALSNGFLECVDLNSGDRMWRKGRYGHGQIAKVDSELLILSEKGQLAYVACSPDQFVQFTSIKALDGVCWNNICVYGEYVLIRSDEEAVCYQMPMRFPEKAKLLSQDGKALKPDPAANAKSGKGRPGGRGKSKGGDKKSGDGKTGDKDKANSKTGTDDKAKKED